MPSPVIIQLPTKRWTATNVSGNQWELVTEERLQDLPTSQWQKIGLGIIHSRTPEGVFTHIAAHFILERNGQSR